MKTKLMTAAALAVLFNTAGQAGDIASNAGQGGWGNFNPLTAGGDVVFDITEERKEEERRAQEARAEAERVRLA
ncbi:hypothetical protein BMR04_16060, partial [Methylococcaceae bacterium HT3]